MGLLEGVTPAKFSFTNASSLHGVCSDGSLVGNRESGEGVNDLVENWALYHSFMVMNYIYLYLSVICCFVFYLCSILFGIISNFQSCRFSGVICSSCIIYMPTHHSILRFLWNSIHRSTSVQTWSSASYLCPRLCAFDSRHYPIPVYLGNQETRFHANVGVLAMKWNVIDTRGAFEVPRRTSSLLDVRGEPLDTQKINVEDTQVS